MQEITDQIAGVQVQKKDAQTTARHQNQFLPTTWVKVKKVKCSRYRPGLAQRVGRGIALLFHDRGTRRGWVVSSTPRPHFTPGKDPVPIAQEAGRAPGLVWTGRKSRPYQNSIPDRPACSQSLYRLSYLVHTNNLSGGSKPPPSMLLTFFA
jgi:hypothetical protein